MSAPKRLGLPQRVYLTCVLVGGIGLVGCSVLFYELRSTSADYENLLTTDAVQHQDQARVIQVTFKKQVQEWKNILLRGSKPDALAKYSKAFLDESAAVQALTQRLSANVDDRDASRMLRDFAAAHAKMDQAYRAALAAFSASGGTDAAGADAQVKGQDRAPTDLLDTLVERLRAVTQEHTAAVTGSVAAGQRLVLLLLLVGIVVGVGTCVVMVRRLIRPFQVVAHEIGAAASQVAGAADQVAGGAQSLSSGATEQAAALEEASAAAEELTAAARTAADQAGKASAWMQNAGSLMQGCNTALDDLVVSMSAIGDSSQRITKIIRTIDEIAFQTNILALNAAVEAARAGEAGMGFAVVAEEVRNLAQRSAQAARDTATLIDEASHRASQGGTKVEQIQAWIGRIAQNSVQVDAVIREIDHVSRQQVQGIQQVRTVVGQLESTTQRTAATAEENAAASEELLAAAATARQLVSDMGAMVGGGASGIDAATGVTLTKAMGGHRRAA